MTTLQPSSNARSISPGVIAPVKEAAAALREADLILSLDWVDLAGTLGMSFDEASWLLTIYSSTLFLGVPVCIWLAVRTTRLVE